MVVLYYQEHSYWTVSAFNIFPFSSIIDMQLVYKIVRLNLTSVNAA